MAREEYLRRNLIHASSFGVVANLDTALARLRKMKRQPRWLIELLARTRQSAAKAPHELAQWRNLAREPDDLSARV